MKDLALSPAADVLFSASSDGNVKAWKLNEPLVSDCVGPILDCTHNVSDGTASLCVDMCVEVL